MKRHGVVRRILWPPDARGPVKFASFLQLMLAVLALGFGVVNVVGWWEVSSRVFESLILFAVTAVLLTLLADTDDRRASRMEQRDLVDAARAATGALEVRVIRAHEIGDGLRRLLEESSEWTFRGGSGRYLRNATLPRLAKIRDRDVNVDIQILDPRDEALCKEYADYRNRYRGDSIRRPDEGKIDTVRNDLLAVIVAAAWYGANTRIRPKVLLLRSFSPLRYDIGTSGLYLTLPDPREPALFAAGGSWFYTSVLDEMRQSAHGHPSLQLPADPRVVTDRKEADSALVAAGLRERSSSIPRGVRRG